MRYALCLAVLCLNLACEAVNEDNTLGGSVERIYPLTFNETRARATPGTVAIQYVDTSLVPVQVIINADAPGFEGRGQYNLADVGDVVGSREGTELPPFLEGQLTLSSYGDSDGAIIRGEFTAQVGDDETRYSVFGTFDTTLERLD